MPFSFSKCTAQNGIVIDGLIKIEPQVFGDKRGYFFESYNEKDFIEQTLYKKFVQDNEAKSEIGVLRGLHFQKQHPQGKLIRVVYGKVYDVAVDLRKGSKTFGKYFGLTLDSEQKIQIYIPEGFAHGFYVLSKEAVSLYKCTDFYHPKDEGGIMWNDPTIGISWKSIAPEIEPLLSEKDKNHPLFCAENNYFDINGTWTNS